MNHKKYNEEDLLNYKEGKITLAELCEKYGVSKQTMWKALNRREIYTRKERIKIIAPFSTTIVNSKQECAEELKVSYSTVRRVLNGVKCKKFEELGYKLEVLK